MSAERRYAEVRYPWRAAIDMSSPAARRHYEALIGQTLRYGRPASRRAGQLWALAGRHGVPNGLVPAAVRLCPRRARPELDELREQAIRRWPDLAAMLPTLPDEPPRLSTLAIRRRSAHTVFLFDADARPLLVLKIPHDGNPGTALEAQALREAQPAAVGPRELGRIGPAHAQEALRGAPLKVEPLGPAQGATLSWPDALGELAVALSRLASTTLKQGRPEQLVEPTRRAIDFGGLTAQTRRLVSAAARDLAGLDRCVLAHRDTSPQNLLCSDGSLVGLVDWEISRSRGIPGFDMANAALAYLEAGVGLRSWSRARVEQTFRNAWADSGFYTEARAAARDVMGAADVPQSLLDALEISFFARRLGQRMDRPELFPTGPQTAALMLNVVCGD